MKLTFSSLEKFLDEELPGKWNKSSSSVWMGDSRDGYSVYNQNGYWQRADEDEDMDNHATCIIIETTTNGVITVDLPDLYVTAPETIWELLRREILEKFSNNNVLVLSGQSEYHQILNKSGVILLPACDHRIVQTNKISNGIELFMVYSVNDAMVFICVQVVIEDGKVTNTTIPEPQWMKSVHILSDLYKNPTNSMYWDTVNFIDEKDAYFGQSLYFSGHTQTWIKPSGCPWIPIDRTWLEGNIDQMPNEIQEEWKMCKNVE
ncbi:hypothetical protein D3C78_19830 [compost metagenome]